MRARVRVMYLFKSLWRFVHTRRPLINATTYPLPHRVYTNIVEIVGSSSVSVRAPAALMRARNYAPGNRFEFRIRTECKVDRWSVVVWWWTFSRGRVHAIIAQQVHRTHGMGRQHGDATGVEQSHTGLHFYPRLARNAEVE